MFTVQAEANAELRDQAAVATRMDVLAVRALGLIALNDSLLRGPLVLGRDGLVLPVCQPVGERPAPCG